MFESDLHLDERSRHVHRHPSSSYPAGDSRVVPSHPLSYMYD